MAIYHDKNLIINYIPRTVEDSWLLGLFSDIGSVKTCRIIRDKNTGVSFGFGFCEYDNPESAMKAIVQLNGYRIGTKSLKVSFARVQASSNSTNLYVRNCPTWVTEQHLFLYFSRYGRIVQCRVLRDHATQQPKGAAYVLFECQNEAESAKENFDGKPWPGSTDGICVSVRFASPPHRLACKKTINNQQFPRNVQSNNPQIEHGNAVNGVNQLASQMLAAYSQPRSNPNIYHNQTRYLQQGVLGQSAPTLQSTMPNMYSFVWPGGDMSSTEMSNTNQFPMTQPVYFSPQTSVPQPTYPVMWPQSFLPNSVSASQLPNTGFRPSESLLNGGPLSTAMAANLGMYNPQESNDVPSNLANMGLKLTQVVQPMRCTKPSEINNTAPMFSIYIYNIGNFMTEAQLFELFARFGNIVNVSIPKDLRTGLGKNFGFVTYSTLASAKSAIEHMHGFRIQDRLLQVSFKKSTISSASNLQSKLGSVDRNNYIRIAKEKQKPDRLKKPQDSANCEVRTVLNDVNTAETNESGIHENSVKQNKPSFVCDIKKDHVQNNVDTTNE